MTRERDRLGGEGSLEDQLQELRRSVRRRWLTLAALVLALCSVLAFAGVNLLEPVRRHRDRMDALCALPLSADGPARTSFGEAFLLGGAKPARTGPHELVDGGRALFLLSADGRSELLADRCRKTAGHGGAQ